MCGLILFFLKAKTNKKAKPLMTLGERAKILQADKHQLACTNCYVSHT